MQQSRNKDTNQQNVKTNISSTVLQTLKTVIVNVIKSPQVQSSLLEQLKSALH